MRRISPGGGGNPLVVASVHEVLNYPVNNGRKVERTKEDFSFFLIAITKPYSAQKIHKPRTISSNLMYKEMQKMSWSSLSVPDLY